jgi:hypothetical protein
MSIRIQQNSTETWVKTSGVSRGLGALKPRLAQLPQQNYLRNFNRGLPSIVGSEKLVKGRLGKESFQNEM